MKKLLFLGLIMVLAYSNIKAQLYMTSTGNVGIGTITPGTLLDVNGGFFRTTYNTQSVPASNSLGGLAIGWNYISGNAEVDLYNVYPSATTSFKFSQITGSGTHSDLVTMSGNGNVGIGTTTPNNLLQVNGLINFDNAKYNTFLGYQTGNTTSTGSCNTFIGYQALYSNTSGSGNVGIGLFSLYANNSGADNIAVGVNALKNNHQNVSPQSSYNTAIGMDALENNNIGAYNTGIGYAALFNNTTGSNNTALGFEALYTNTTGTNNTALGYGANVNAGTYTWATAIGAGAQAIASKGVYIRDAVNVTYIGGRVGWSVFSDGRFKFNITENVKGLEFIKKLRPVNYQMNTKQLDNFIIQNMPDSMKIRHQKGMDFATSTNIVHSGFIAQEVNQAAKACGFTSSIVNTPADSSTGIYSLGYAEFVVPLVKAVQELNTKIDSLKSQLGETIKEQNTIISELQQQINNCCNTNTGSLKSNKRTSGQDSSDVNSSNNSKSAAVLYQNAPNPFSQETQIKCYIPKESMDASLYIYDMQGNQIKKIQITGKEYVYLTIQASELSAGMYMYSLIIDGKEIDTKKMILTK